MVVSIVFHAALVLASGSITLAVNDPGEDRRTRDASPLRVVAVAPSEPAAAAEPADAQDRARPVPAFAPPDVSVRRAAPSLVGRDPLRLAASPALPAFDAGSATPPLGGTGAGSPAGSETSYTAPRARSILRAWKPPRSLIGREVLVRVHTDANGKATGPVELRPPTQHSDTDRELVYRARAMTYWPALSDGEPVDGWAEISFQFCYDGVTAASPPSPTYGTGDACGATVVEGSAGDTG